MEGRTDVWEDPAANVTVRLRASLVRRLDLHRKQQSLLASRSEIIARACEHFLGDVETEKESWAENDDPF